MRGPGHDLAPLAKTAHSAARGSRLQAMLEFRVAAADSDDDYGSSAISVAAVGFACVQRRRQPYFCVTTAAAEGAWRGHCPFCSASWPARPWPRARSAPIINRRIRRCRQPLLLRPRKRRSSRAVAATAARSIPRNGGALCATASSKSLIGRAVAASPTLEIALNRLQEARAQEAVVVGSALPMLEGSEGGALGTGSDLARGRASPPLVSAENGTGFAQVNNLVGFDAGWELDLFGKFRREIEAAHYEVGAAAAARNIVLVSLIADVTRAYLDMRALQMQLVVLRKSIDVAQHYVDFVQERFNRGITNELDVTLAQRELGQLQSQVAPLIARIDAARYVIAVLAGASRKSRQGIAQAGRAAEASSAHPARVADRAAASPAGCCRGRTPYQRHRVIGVAP